jgi:beta-N-acetylhexosaminidase
MFCVGFDTPRPTSELLSLLEKGVGAVALFSRNVESPGQLNELCSRIKTAAAGGVLTCLDQEGGRVRRLRGDFTDIPSMRVLGRTGDPELAREVGRVLARELRAVNVDLDFAPVVDVDTNPQNPVISDRSFGPDAAMVGRMGAALVRGLQDNGVGACAKHFPGHGDTNLDSHHALPRVSLPADRLESVELAPFRDAINAGVWTLMTAHIVFDALDAEVPATISPKIIEQLARRRMGFDGVIVTDDMEMKAIASHFGIEDAAVAAILAGVDLVMICHSPDLQNRAIERVADAMDRGIIPPSRVAESKRRMDRLRAQCVRPPQPLPAGVIGSEDHKAILQRVLERSDQVREASIDPTEAWRGSGVAQPGQSL